MDIRLLGRVEYLPTYEAMQAFTAERCPDTPNELWICEHPPVFTQPEFIGCVGGTRCCEGLHGLVSWQVRDPPEQPDVHAQSTILTIGCEVRAR